MTTMPAGPWVLVIGCHRSGTSAIAGALVALGLQGVDPADRMDRLASNPEHWESLAAALFDEDLLAQMDAAWDAPPDPGAEVPRTTPAPGVPAPADIMATAYPEPGPVVWKDPRACLLLPYWRELLPGPLTAVFVWREPLAVARSLHRRDGIPLAEGLALWERYNASAAAGLQGVDTYVLDYDAVVRDPRQALGAVADWLAGLERFAPWSDTWDRDAAGRSVDTGLRHETAEAAPDDGALPTDHRALLEWLEARPGGHLPLDDEPPGPTSVWPEVVLAGRRERAVLAREIARTHRRQAEYDQTMAVLRDLVMNREVKLGEARADLARARAELDGVRTQLDNTLASTSWRVTRPLRTVIERRPD